MTEPYYGVTVSTTINGDSYNFRANDAEGAKELFAGLAEHADDIITNLSSFKQVAVAKGVNTGPAQSKSSGGSGGRERAKDSAPAGDGVPECKHGPMDDLGDPAESGYKARYYCTLKTKNYKEKCKPQN